MVWSRITKHRLVDILNAADVIIDRDVEFSSERVANSANQDPKNPFRRSFGGVMGSMQRFLTHSAPSPTSSNNNYTFRPAGTSSLKNSVNYSTISDQSVMTGGKGVSLKKHNPLLTLMVHLIKVLVEVTVSML